MAHVMFTQDHAHAYEETDASKHVLSFHTNLKFYLTHKKLFKGWQHDHSVPLTTVRQHLARLRVMTASPGS
jgi:hypothetical protein